MRLFSGADQEWLWLELAHAVRQEQSLPDVLQGLAASHAGTRRGAMAGALAASVASGMSLSAAVTSSGSVFGPGVGVSLEAGERSGDLDDVLDSLSDNARADGAFRDTILAAVTYPLALTLVALIAVVANSRRAICT